MGDSGATLTGTQRWIEARSVRRFVLARANGELAPFECSSGHCSVGSHESNEIVLADPTVSRFHCEIKLDENGAPTVRDLGSKNGTFIDGVRVVEGYLKNGSTIHLGDTELRFQIGTDRSPRVLSEKTELGPLVGASPEMRVAYGVLERAALSDATVLIEGETGTGKEGAAEALHMASKRKDKPLVVVDCGALPAALLESELFGHEKGAFTGAATRRIGAFEEAQGGTIFLDEIGELPLDLQPKLLRVLERKEIRRLGSNAMLPVDVRVVAATHRDLRTAVNQNRFRSDLFFRLAVVKVQLPPLRHRAEDIPLLAERLLLRLGATRQLIDQLCTPAFLGRLAEFAWPGNVRELRNYLERCLVFQRELPLGDELGGEPTASESSVTVDRGAYAEARRRALHAFEKKYLEQMLAAHGGAIDPMAAEAGIHRVSLYRLLRRHGLKTSE